MFWLATLNPAGRRGRKRKVRMGRRDGRGRFLKRARAKARKVRRGGGGRRKLSMWQRMVKKFGGVMQALKHRKKIRKSANKGRRSAVSRARARGRSRTKHKEVNMARTRRARRHRSTKRGRGGRFVSRRNPGRRRRRRSNPLFRAARAGRYSRRGRRLHQVRPGGKGWHNPRRRRSYRRNSVIPVSWNPGRRRRRHYRRNSVLPISWNPSGVVSGVVGRVKSFTDVRFWTETALPATAGFIGTKVAGGFIYGFVGEKLMGLTGAEAHAPYVKIGSQAIAAAGLSILIGKFVGQKQGQAVFVGGVIAVTHALLKQILGGTQIASAIGLDGLGDDLSSRMRDAVRRRVEQNLQGYGAYLTLERGTQMNGLDAYVTERELRARQGFAPSPGADLRDYDVARSDTSF